ncbi:MAG: tetraacyldisaccharide 4'-kinase [Cyclobacteriaceae bacterium]|nr:tetraacyldisaccharide 4'-kinase [Cyclobacteriaceae bacterium]
MTFFKYFLLPFAWLFNLATRLRNYVYDIGHKKSFQFDSVVICVGNLNVGGSGKTPMVEYLVNLLSPQFKVATLSRGYGRNTKGFRIANEQDNARTIGDEPYQLFRKFGSKITVAVGEERALAIPTILHERPEVQVIIMDDAFQHRAVIPQFSILLTDYQKPFYKDFLLPFGRLREARIGARRAHTIVVTKCTGLTVDKEEQVRASLKKIVGTMPVFFSETRYKAPVPIGHSNKITDEVVLVSGIAKNEPLEIEVSKYFKVLKHFTFPDHHVYTKENIEGIHEAADANGINSILTTEKDMVKLIAQPVFDSIQKKNWFYLPIHAAFIKNGSDFDALVSHVVLDKLKEAPDVENTETLS